MNITTIEALYLRKFKDQYSKRSDEQQLDLLKQRIIDFQDIPSFDRPAVYDNAHEIIMQAYGMGICEKMAADDGDFSNLCLVVSSKVDIDTGKRQPVSFNVLRGLTNDGARLIKAVNCDFGQNDDMNTFVLFVDTPPKSMIHQKLEASAGKYNLDIRISTRKIFE